MSALRPAVFLDRDGVLIHEENYLSDPDLVRLTPGAGPAVARLNAAGWVVAVVTNQSGVARGLFPLERVDAVHARIDALLAEAGAHVDGWYSCPHHPTEGVGPYRVDCPCRKPKPGLLLRAAADLKLDVTRSWMIGDTVRDLEAGAAVGCRTVLVRTGHGGRVDPAALDANRLNLAGLADDLAGAVATYILGRT